MNTTQYTFFQNSCCLDWFAWFNGRFVCLFVHSAYLAHMFMLSVCFERPQEFICKAWSPQNSRCFHLHACTWFLPCDTHSHSYLIGRNSQKTGQPCFLVTSPLSPCWLFACLLKCFHSSRPACCMCTSLSQRHALSLLVELQVWLYKVVFCCPPLQWIHYWAGLSDHCCFGVQYRTSNQYDTLQGKDRVRAQLAPLLCACH